MADENEAVEAEAEVVEKKQRKPRKTKPKVEKTTKRAARGPSSVKQEGATITLEGSDVRLQYIPPPEQKKYGIRDIEGAYDKPCKTPVKLTFRSPAKAAAFFDMCAYAGTEDEDEGAVEYIKSGSKTDWYSDALSAMGG